MKVCDTEIQKVVVMLLPDTGLRRGELASIRVDDVDMDTRTIRIVGKGKKRRVVGFGDVTASCLKSWISMRQVSEEILGISAAGISSLLVALGKRTDIRCNAHSFRRLFACDAIRHGVN